MAHVPGLVRLIVGIGMVLLLVPAAHARDDREQILLIDHFVPHVSTAPSARGETVQLYVRERVQAGAALTSPSFEHRVVLFVHGATIPSEVVFDAEYQDYSWMNYLAQAGLDVFAVDQTGYGRSTRPSPMEDPCNAAPASQAALSPFPLAETCPSSYTDLMTTIASDWDDLDTVVDYLRALRQVDKVSLVAWSRGGPRAGGYAGRHPEKIDRLVMLAPAYLRGEPEPETLGAMTITTQAGFESNWNSQIGCADQYDPQIRESLWSQYLESDSTAALWGRGVGRAPSQGTANTIRRTWGLGAQAIAAPTLLISGDHDVQVPPDDVRTLYEDLRMTRKVFAGLACSSHNAAWELPHLTLFQASAEWLLEGTVNGRSEGLIRLGD